MPSSRKYFGEEACFVMDAKSMGNLGRYLNVSGISNALQQFYLIHNGHLTNVISLQLKNYLSVFKVIANIKKLACKMNE